MRKTRGIWRGNRAFEIACFRYFDILFTTEHLPSVLKYFDKQRGKYSMHDMPKQTDPNSISLALFLLTVGASSPPFHKTKDIGIFISFQPTRNFNQRWIKSNESEVGRIEETNERKETTNKKSKI